MGVWNACCSADADQNNVTVGVIPENNKQNLKNGHLRDHSVVIEKQRQDDIYDKTLKVGDTRKEFVLQSGSYVYTGDVRLQNFIQTDPNDKTLLEPNWVQHGKGEQVWQGECAYSGEWENGQQQGTGEMKWDEGGKVYEGEWKLGMRHGQGKLEWSDGRSYIGNFKNNMKHGNGTYQWANGQKYDGGFRFDKLDGYAEFTNTKGVRRNSEWNKGERKSWVGEKGDSRHANIDDQFENEKLQSEIKLTYFDGHGRAEPIRQMLAHANINWQDERISFDSWPELKENAPGQSMPYITYKDGLQIGDSMLITKLLGQDNGYYPVDPLQRLEIDQILKSTDNFFPAVAGPLYLPPDQQEDAKQKNLNEVIPNYLATIEERLGEGEWLVGSDLTIADFWVAGILFTSVLNNPNSMYPSAARENILADFPHFKAYGERYSKNIQDWLDNRPQAPG